jgi:Zn-dependent peptidase ImmA (M78 family)
MDEFTAVLKAREFVKKANPTTTRVPMEAYLDLVGAKLKLDRTMAADEAGCSFELNGRRFIGVNANDRHKRQRFSICHEVAHIILELASEHGASPWWSYAKRSPNEILCDVFAAELLLPYTLFRPFVEKAEIGFAAVAELAKKFEASLTATGSRFATLCRAPCAFVLSEQGKVRYSARSAALRDAKAWISPGSLLPDESSAARLRAGIDCDGPEEIAADLWFNDWERGGVLLEEARYFNPWDQTLSLIWFEDEEVPSPPRTVKEEEEEVGLRELDGTLPWPGKKRRR